MKKKKKMKNTLLLIIFNFNKCRHYRFNWLFVVRCFIQTTNSQYVFDYYKRLSIKTATFQIYYYSILK